MIVKYFYKTKTKRIKNYQLFIKVDNIIQLKEFQFLKIIAHNHYPDEIKKLIIITFQKDKKEESLINLTQEIVTKKIEIKTLRDIIFHQDKINLYRIKSTKIILNNQVKK